MNSKKFITLSLIWLLTISSCKNTKNYKQDLLSGNKQKIINACHEIGEKRDTSYVKNLLYKALDPRITHDIRYKGISINHIRLITLQKISKYAYKEKIKQYEVDTTATFFFINWAIKNGYLKNVNDVDINFLK